MFYLDLPEETLRAFKVAKEIDQWLEERNTSGTLPSANVTVAAGVLLIAIGELCVWDSENRDGDEELTMDVCLRDYRRYLDDLINPFVDPCPTCKGSGEIQEDHGNGAVETLTCPQCMGDLKPRNPWMPPERMMS
jgi:hypothetical protein